MEDILDWKPLKLRAVDDQDLQVFSQCLYEAIIISSEIHYNKNNKQFAMAIERFTWENARDKGHLLMQVLSIIIINNVESVNMRGLLEKNKIKNILSISNVDNNILIMLNNDEIKWIDTYHENVYKNLSEFMQEKELVWLKKSCGPILQ